MKRLFFWSILNILGIFLFLAALREGWVAWVFSFDVTGISYIICGVFIYGVAASGWNSWRQTKWAIENCVTLGFLGTIIGLLLALTNVDQSQLGSFDQLPAVFAQLVKYLGVAFSTSIVGTVAGTWLYAIQNFGMDRHAR